MAPGATQSGKKGTNATAVNRDKPITRQDNRRTGSTLLIEGNEEIRSATEGRKFLETHLYLCPAGEPADHTSLAICLHQISAISGVPGVAKSAIRAVAFMLNELEETTINSVVRDAFSSQITEFTSDMQLLIDNAKDKIDQHLASAMEDRPIQQAGPGYRPKTYAEALISPPPHANPRLAAREGIRARQMMLEGVKESKVGGMNSMQLKAEFNRILGKLGLEGQKIRTVMAQKHGGTLIELETDAAAKWMLREDNRAAFCRELGPEVSFKNRSYTVIAFNAPLTIEPGNEKHRDEVCEANHLEPGTVVGMRWAKPIQRRSPKQKTAHLILILNDANAANRAIAQGLTICNRTINVEKMKKEPIRCLKCQGWNHYAYECLSKVDKCGTCAGEHRTSQCQNTHQLRCVSCDDNTHASWSRDCPLFLKKLEECNRRHLENMLQFFPTADSWTWTLGEVKESHRPKGSRHEAAQAWDWANPYGAEATYALADHNFGGPMRDWSEPAHAEYLGGDSSNGQQAKSTQSLNA